MARRWMAALAALAIAGLSAGAAGACGGPPVCTVIDPTGTPLNVRDGPNGAILATLKRGAMVEVVEHRDHQGKRWALIARYAEAWGWVFGAYLSCSGSDGLGEICVVADPTGTPLNIRTEPNGEILGTWANGVRVRPYEQKTHNGKVWYAVERLAEDNAEGWVFDPYLGCEEDEEH